MNGSTEVKNSVERSSVQERIIEMMRWTSAARTSGDAFRSSADHRGDVEHDVDDELLCDVVCDGLQIQSSIQERSGYQSPEGQ